jgi:hypothetical protein
MEHLKDECPSCSTVGEQIQKEDVQASPPLSHWPIQIKLMGTVIPFLNNADLLVAADCTAFATREFHDRYLKDKKVLIGCPKLDDAMFYVDKFTEIFSNIPVKSVTCLRMQVPCCGGMTAILKEALKRSGKETIPFKEIILGVKGECLSERN